MTPERWRQLEELYDAVRDLSSTERGVRLKEADPELASAVEAIFAQKGSLLDHAAWEGRTGLQPSPAPVKEGAQLGPYRIERCIGKGGMGEVYLARDSRLHRDVAIKILPSDTVADPERMRRFLQEARAVAALNHPHICQIYDVGPDYLVLEYVEGKPLKGPIAIAETLRLALQIASALQEAHGKGILHRDLKPDNILLTAAGEVKLLDFGLAKMDVPAPSGHSTLTVGLTEPGVVLGTLAYMSPEQAQCHPVDARSDIFSFGLVLYSMVSGRQAFAGSSPFALMTAIVKDEPPPLDAPPALDRIVRRCLAKQPAGRFQTMAEVLGALQQMSARPEEEGPSIAVLPFANMSGDKEQEYFSDGLAEEIIHTLAQLPGLKVTARTSAFAFRGKEQDITRIAGELHVRTILEGSVRKAGNRIRVTAQLIDAANGYHLWSHRYDRDLEDVFAVQDEIATAIAAALQVKLSVQPAVLRSYTPRIPAYEAHLKARYQLGRATPEALTSAQGYCEQAIALDPGFAQPWVDLASCLVLSAGSGVLAAHDAMPRARAKALRAVDIDPEFHSAQAMLGVIAGRYDYDWTECGRRFHLAMARGSVSPDLRRIHAFGYLLPMGRIEEAVQELRKVIPEDPLYLRARMELEICLTAAGRYEEAAAEIRHALDLDDRFYPAHLSLGRNFALQGRFPEALAPLEKAYSLAPWQPVVIGLLAGLVAHAGDAGRSDELLQKLGPGDAYGAPMGLTYFYVLRGDMDHAANWCQKAIEQRDLRAVNAGYLLGANFRSGPRWPALAKMMNLPDGV